MTFFCDGCEKEQDHYELSLVVAPANSMDIKRFCRSCRNPKSNLPDVYWDGKPEENLADDPATGRPRIFSSKFEKANYLKEKGLQEAGDRYHGAPIQFHRNQNPKTDNRHEVKMALKRVREMGIDVRRQEYNRIKKEGQRYA